MRALLVALAVALAGMACDGGGGDPQPTATRSPDPTQTPRPSSTAPPPTPVRTFVSTPSDAASGIIEGSLSYPASGIPDEMIVCARSVDTNVEYCTDEHVFDDKYTYSEGYRLAVPPGVYEVYAIVSPGLVGTYSDFFTCGLLPSCTSHELIPVTVAAGVTVDGIDPGDWYTPPP